MKLSHGFLVYFFLFLFSCQPSNNQFFEPPKSTKSSKPWTRWWWHGSSVTKEGITAELESLQKAGFGGVEITPIYGVIGEEDQFVNFLSDEWVELLEFTLQAA